eukprot:12142317-Karenia_brevis.AAC.1
MDWCRLFQSPGQYAPCCFSWWHVAQLWTATFARVAAARLSAGGIGKQLLQEIPRVWLLRQSTGQNSSLAFSSPHTRQGRLTSAAVRWRLALASARVS